MRAYLFVLVESVVVTALVAITYKALLLGADVLRVPMVALYLAIQVVIVGVLIACVEMQRRRRGGAP